MTLVLGLTGGIGSGKSEVARMLARRGAVIVDADLLAREVVEPGTSGLAGVVERFGPEALDEGGRLRRRWLGALVFSDPDALAELNALLHPLIRALLDSRLRRARRRAPPLVVLDAALLVELGLVDRCDRVAVVRAPEATRLARLARRDGLDPQAARARFRAQAGDEERLAIADHVIDNSGSLKELERRVAVLWGELGMDDGRR